MALSKVNRVEVIDQNGRAYVQHDVQDVVLHFQDDQQTLKLFLKLKDARMSGEQ